jgi:hypothetical protein
MRFHLHLFSSFMVILNKEPLRRANARAGRLDASASSPWFADLSPSVAAFRRLPRNRSSLTSQIDVTKRPHQKRKGSMLHRFQKVFGIAHPAMSHFYVPDRCILHVRRTRVRRGIRNENREIIQVCSVSHGAFNATVRRTP